MKPEVHKTFHAETFDIFAGVTNRAVWVEAVEGIDQARNRMHQIAHDKPGDYFIFHSRTRVVLDKLSTAKPEENNENAKSGAA